MLTRLKDRLTYYTTYISPSYDASTDLASLRRDKLLAVNLGKNKVSPVDSVDDFLKGIRSFGEYVDVLVISTSGWRDRVSERPDQLRFG